MEKNIYYIAYSAIESENVANRIQSKNTYESFKKIAPSLKGMFLANRRSLFWRIVRKQDKYFVDRPSYKTSIIEKYLKLGFFRKDLFPYIFARKVKKILKKDSSRKNIYVRPASVSEGLLYLRNLERLKVDKIIFELHNLNFEIPNFYYWGFEKKYCHKKHVEFFNLLKNNPQRTGLVTLTKALADNIRDRFNYEQNVEVIPDAHNFVNNKPKNINFNKEKIEIIYTGLNLKLKGVEILLNALKSLPNKFYIRLVGGAEYERDALMKKYKPFIFAQRLFLEPPVPHSSVKQKLEKADIAILSTPEKGFSNSTSPLKLFEYMAVGIPIVASNTRSFREVLAPENALFFEENNSKDLAEKINYLAENEGLARKIGGEAFEDSKRYTYQRRAEKIYSLFQI